MADYIATARSNFFRVKNKAAFKKWSSSRELGVWEEGTGEKKKFAIYADGPNEDGWPTTLYNEKTEKEIDVDIEGELVEHLKDGSVAVLMTTGSMGYEDLYGYAVAINSKGEEVRIDVHEIYDRAASLGDEITSVA